MVIPNVLLITMLSEDISCFQNSVDSDQLASHKQTDQDLYFFPILPLNPR